MNKKGTSLDNLYPAVLAILMIGIALGLGIFILNETGDAISTDTLSVVNETVTGLAVAGDSVAAVDYCGAHDFVISAIFNSTGGEEILGATNYTTDTDGAIYATAGSEYIDENINVSYSYTGTGDTSTTGPCGSMDTTGTGLGGFATWIAVIVVVLAAAIVLGIVISSFGKSSSA